MTTNQTQEKTKDKRAMAKQAVALAMQGRWEEAATVNKALIEISPEDSEAYNRLGKALAELGRYSEAKAAFGKALVLSPSNIIAKKNLERMGHLMEGEGAPGELPKASPKLFIEETGKSTVTSLIELAPKEVLAKIAAGTLLQLRPDAHKLIVEDTKREYLGTVPPRLGLRLIRLMNAGNQYAAAVTSVNGEVKVIIKETYQHPSQANTVSFPSKGADNFRSYVKGGLLKLDEGRDEVEEVEEWGDDETEPESDRNRGSVSGFQEEVPGVEAASEEESEYPAARAVVELIEQGPGCIPAPVSFSRLVTLRALCYDEIR